MSVRFSLGILTLIFSAFSCNHSSKTITESLQVSIDLQIYKKDTIQLFYITETDNSYTEALSIKQSVEGKDELQTLRYKLPIGVKPKNIRIDLGERSNYHDSIKIENISFRYRDLVLDGNNGKYKNWFDFNQNIYWETDTLTYKLKVVDNFYDPILNGNKVLNSKLVKLFTPHIYER
jgi:hypothetical protein